MMYIEQLAKVLAKKSQPSVMTGQYKNGNVQVGNNGYRPVNAGDTQPVNDRPVYCIVDGNECYVVSDK
jgi:hypothetical protein